MLEPRLENKTNSPTFSEYLLDITSVALHDILLFWLKIYRYPLLIDPVGPFPTGKKIGRKIFTSEQKYLHFCLCLKMRNISNWFEKSYRDCEKKL